MHVMSSGWTMLRLITAPSWRDICDLQILWKDVLISSPEKHIVDSYGAGLYTRVSDRDYEEAKGIYINRTFGGCRHYRSASGDTDARTATCQETGQDGCLSGKPGSMGYHLVDVLRRQQQLFPKEDFYLA